MLQQRSEILSSAVESLADFSCLLAFQPERAFLLFCDS